jgi:hypothetical protein
MKNYFNAIAIAALLLQTQAATASDVWQDRFQWEVRPGFAFPTENFFGGEDLDNGFGFSGSVAMMFTPNIGAYAGLDVSAFNNDNSFAGRNVDVLESGYSLGLQVQSPLNNSGSLGFRARAGLTYADIELWPDYERDALARSGHGRGWEVGVAMVIALPNKWMITPGIRYRALGRNLDYVGTVRRVRLDYVSVGVGFSRTF